MLFCADTSCKNRNTWSGEGVASQDKNSFYDTHLVQDQRSLRVPSEPAESMKSTQTIPDQHFQG